MAHGMPDYNRDVRPKYGAAQVAWRNITAVANSLNALVEISGKGVIYGGLLALYGYETQQISTPHLTVDGTIIAQVSFQSYNRYNMTVENCFPFYLLKYDNVAFIYALGISSMMTFESSFKVEYDENDGGTPTVWCRVIYALI